MSSYTTRTSSYSYTQPKAAPAPAIDTNAIISEAERRCGDMIKQRMDSLQTAIDAQYLVMSREAINIRAEQSRELGVGLELGHDAVLIVCVYEQFIRVG